MSFCPDSCTYGRPPSPIGAVFPGRSIPTMTSISPAAEIKDRQHGNLKLQSELIFIITNHKGIEQAITLEQIRIDYYPNHKTTRAIRDALGELILRGYPICHKSGVGHFLAATVEEAQSCKEGEYMPRIADLRMKGDKLVENAIAYYGNQTGMVLPSSI